LPLSKGARRAYISSNTDACHWA